MRERVEACRYSGADVLCVVATEIDGLWRRGCATVDWEIPHPWDPDRYPVLPRGAEELIRSLPEGTAVHFVRYLGTGWIAVVGHSGEGLQVGDALGAGSCVASRQWTTLAERRVLAVLAIDSPQGVAAVRAAPGLIENVVERNPHVIADNRPEAARPPGPIAGHDSKFGAKRSCDRLFAPNLESRVGAGAGARVRVRGCGCAGAGEGVGVRRSGRGRRGRPGVGRRGAEPRPWPLRRRRTRCVAPGTSPRACRRAR